MEQYRGEEQVTSMETEHISEEERTALTSSPVIIHAPSSPSFRMFASEQSISGVQTSTLSLQANMEKIETNASVNRESISGDHDDSDQKEKVERKIEYRSTSAMGTGSAMGATTSGFVTRIPRPISQRAREVSNGSEDEQRQRVMSSSERLIITPEAHKHYTEENIYDSKSNQKLRQMISESLAGKRDRSRTESPMFNEQDGQQLEGKKGQATSRNDLLAKYPKFVVPISDNLTLRRKARAELKARLEPRNDPDMRIEWFKDDIPIDVKSSAGRISSYFNRGYVALIITNFDEKLDSGKYTCVATNSFGTARCQAELRLDCRYKLVKGESLSREEKLAKLMKIKESMKQQELLDAKRKAELAAKRKREAERELELRRRNEAEKRISRLDWSKRQMAEEAERRRQKLLSLSEKERKDLILKQQQQLAQKQQQLAGQEQLSASGEQSSSSGARVVTPYRELDDSVFLKLERTIYETVKEFEPQADEKAFAKKVSVRRDQHKDGGAVGDDELAERRKQLQAYLDEELEYTRKLQEAVEAAGMMSADRRLKWLQMRYAYDNAMRAANEQNYQRRPYRILEDSTILRKEKTIFETIKQFEPDRERLDRRRMMIERINAAQGQPVDGGASRQDEDAREEFEQELTRSMSDKQLIDQQIRLEREKQRRVRYEPFVLSSSPRQESALVQDNQLAAYGAGDQQQRQQRLSISSLEAQQAIPITLASIRSDQDGLSVSLGHLTGEGDFPAARNQEGFVWRPYQVREDSVILRKDKTILETVIEYESEKAAAKEEKAVIEPVTAPDVDSVSSVGVPRKSSSVCLISDRIETKANLDGKSEDYSQSKSEKQATISMREKSADQSRRIEPKPDEFEEDTRSVYSRYKLTKDDDVTRIDPAPTSRSRETDAKSPVGHLEAQSQLDLRPSRVDRISTDSQWNQLHRSESSPPDRTERADTFAYRREAYQPMDTVSLGFASAEMDPTITRKDYLRPSGLTDASEEPREEKREARVEPVAKSLKTPQIITEKVVEESAPQASRQLPSPLARRIRGGENLTSPTDDYGQQIPSQPARSELSVFVPSDVGRSKSADRATFITRRQASEPITLGAKNRFSSTSLSELRSDTLAKYPRFMKPLLDQDRLRKKSRVELKSRIEPVDDDEMRVEWYKDDVLIEPNYRMSTYFNFGYAALIINNFDERDEGRYTCVATNRLGNDKVQCRLSLDRRYKEAEGEESESRKAVKRLAQLQETMKLAERMEAEKRAEYESKMQIKAKLEIDKRLKEDQMRSEARRARVRALAAETASIETQRRPRTPDTFRAFVDKAHKDSDHQERLRRRSSSREASDRITLEESQSAEVSPYTSGDGLRYHRRPYRTLEDSTILRKEREIYETVREFEPEEKRTDSDEKQSLVKATNDEPIPKVEGRKQTDDSGAVSRWQARRLRGGEAYTGSMSQSVSPTQLEGAVDLYKASVSGEQDDRGPKLDGIKRGDTLIEAAAGPTTAQRRGKYSESDLEDDDYESRITIELKRGSQELPESEESRNKRREEAAKITSTLKVTSKNFAGDDSDGFAEDSFIYADLKKSESPSLDEDILKDLDRLRRSSDPRDARRKVVLIPSTSKEGKSQSLIHPKHPLASALASPTQSLV